MCNICSPSSFSNEPRMSENSTAFICGIFKSKPSLNTKDFMLKGETIRPCPVSLTSISITGASILISFISFLIIDIGVYRTKIREALKRLPNFIPLRSRCVNKFPLIFSTFKSGIELILCLIRSRINPL